MEEKLSSKGAPEFVSPANGSGEMSVYFHNEEDCKLFLIYCNNCMMGASLRNKLSLLLILLLASAQAQENIIDTSQSAKDSVLTPSEETVDDSFHPKDFC